MPGMMGWSKPSWLFRDHPSFGIFDQPSGLNVSQDRPDVFLEMEASARETRTTTGWKKGSFFCNSLVYAFHVFPVLPLVFDGFS